MDDAQRTLFAKVFNFSVTGLAGTWLEIERERGKRRYEETDAYVNWCEKHGVAVELHFLSGYEPVWAVKLRAAERANERMQHVRRMIGRYRDRVAYWEVTDDGVGAEEAGVLFAMIRKELPGAKLGIGACVRFGSDAGPAMRERDMWRGLELVRELQRTGGPVDFVSFHAHRPWGWWADARWIEQTIDAFAKEGVRVHMSQLAVPDDGPIGGPVRQGRWTRGLQAEYYRDFFTVCFGNANVDAINLEAMGADTLTTGAGLLDEHDQPTAGYAALEKLIRHDWRTELSGELGLDGVVRFRGFHGDYELTLTLGDGRTATARFAVEPGGSNAYRFVLDQAGGKLEVGR
ncbi:MAG: endo-1,4-beta-xylanase [Phycisphaerales bacterium]